MRNKKKAIIFMLLFVSAISLVYANNFQDISLSDFNNGTYANIIHNGTGIVLSENNLTGVYVSRIFDATSAARWENLSWRGNMSTKEYLFAVDAGADVWNSANQGVNWSLIKSDYNEGDANGAWASFFNSSGSYFVIYNQKVYISVDMGLSWTKINDNYNGAEGQNADAANVNLNDSLFIIEGDQDVWMSNNSGVNWTKTASNFNGGSGAVKGLVINSSNTLMVIDASADFWSSNDGITWTKINDDYNGGEGNSATTMAIINDTVYILDSTAVWKSSDFGVTFTKQTSDFNPNDANVGVSMITDSANNLYIIDGGEDVYKSNNSGVNWTKTASNFNGGNGNANAFSFIVRRTNITFQIKNCSLADCLDGIWQDFNLNNINLTGRYFQYKAFFSSQEAGATPILNNVSLDYTILDNIPPIFSNYIENPGNNSAYSSGQVYRFNATITDNTAIGSVWIEFNGVNWTNVVNTSSNYMFSIGGLGAGSYSYRWWTNDTFGNINNSELRAYFVEKGENTLTLLSSSGWGYNYGTESSFSCSALSGAPNLYMDGVEISNPLAIVLSAGTHNAKCNISESENYSAGISQNIFSVNKISPIVSLSFDKSSPQIYGASVIPTCSLIFGIGTPNLTLNGGGISSGGALTLGAGIWNFNCSIVESQNYSSGSNYSQFVINPVPTTTSIIVNPDFGINYGTASNFSCSNSVGLETRLYINGSDKDSEKGIEVVRAAGNYVLNCSFAGNQNYSASSEQINYAINKSVGNISLFLNGQEGDLTIDYPQQYNISAKTFYGEISIYINGTDVSENNSLNVTPTRNEGYYNITAVSSGDENHSSKSLTRWLNVSLDASAPILMIVSPQEGGAYGYNQDLPLEYSVFDEHRESCWYNLNNGTNITLFGCGNSTFNASADGQYYLYLYANDSLGNLAMVNTTFSVLVGSPTIILNSPIGVYLNFNNAVFRYTPSDMDLGSCELWGDFDGEFKLNQTNPAPANGTENTFNLSLEDGAYKWNIRCNDSIGHSAFNGNKSFYVDMTAPSLLISEPNGIKLSRINVPLVFFPIDASPLNCLFNVQWATGGIVISNTSIANCTSTSFNLSTDGDYILNLYARDYSGNANFSSIGFSVDSLTQPPAGQPGGGGGGGGGGGIASRPANTSGTIGAAKISFGKIEKLALKRGTGTNIEIEVINSGKIFLNECKLKGRGDLAGWLENSQNKGLSSGEKYKYAANIKVPEETEPGEYELEMRIECDEGSDSSNLEISVFRNNFESKIKEYIREVDKIRVFYSMKEFAQEAHNLALEYRLVNFEDVMVVEGEEKVELGAGEEREGVLEFRIPKDLSGEFKLKLLLNDGKTSNELNKNIILQTKSILGLAISDSNAKTLSILGIIILSAMAVFFASWSAYNFYRKFKLRKIMGKIEEKHGRRLIKLDL